jgi:UrcA family protein
MRINNSIIKTALMGCAAAALVIPATVQAGESTAAIKVKTADLDLSTTSGQRTLKLRLLHAISHWCPIGAKCRDAALAKVTEKADEMITQAAEGKQLPQQLTLTISR